jgi:hypothetical protein
MDCKRCGGFKENPERIVSPKIGSRNDQTTVYWNKEKVTVICGCFKGDIEEFEKAVNTTHKNTKYLTIYQNFINKVRHYMNS